MPSLSTIIIVLAITAGLFLLAAAISTLFMSKRQAQQEDEEWAEFLRINPSIGQ
jgi:hypothetical protein